MSGSVYAIVGGKGGVGKTTTATNLAATCRAAGQSVALVDADLAMSNLQAVVGVSHEPTLHDVLAGTATLEEATLAESAPGDGGGRLDLVPGATDLETFAEADPAELPSVLHTLAEEYDLVVVDTGSGLTHESAIPIEVADASVVVTTPERTAVRDAEKTGEFVRSVGGTVAGLVVSQLCAGLPAETVADIADLDLLATVENLNAPGTDPLAPYRDLADGLLGDESGDSTGVIGEVDPEATPYVTGTLEPAPGTDQPDAGPDRDGPARDDTLDRLVNSIGPSDD